MDLIRPVRSKISVLQSLCRLSNTNINFRYNGTYRKLISFSEKARINSNLFKNVIKINTVDITEFKNKRTFSSGTGGNRNPMKLMDYANLIWPNPIKTARNYIFCLLIKGYFDPEFSFKEFLRGAEMAICNVSSDIQSGCFDRLEGLVEDSAIEEIKYNYDKLSLKQRSLISVQPEEFFLKFIHEIGLIFDDKDGKRFVEITTVFQGIHGAENPNSNTGFDVNTVRDNCYVCNYRFVREYTKGIEDAWVINKLNHFFPAELADATPPFHR